MDLEFNNLPLHLKYTSIYLFIKVILNPYSDKFPNSVYIRTAGFCAQVLMGGGGSALTPRTETTILVASFL